MPATGAVRQFVSQQSRSTAQHFTKAQAALLLQGQEDMVRKVRQVRIEKLFDTPLDSLKPSIKLISLYLGL